MPNIFTRDYEVFRQRLVQAREDAGLKQADVAEALGKPQSYVSKCERGERRLDAIELAQLAKLYDKPISFFIAHVEIE
ncbi:MAG: helix-turn-helix domain-containing protein [Candidatus Pacebacteria bacterium]|nr:helix-turn-helix domain-containing protein [Candidatus Paceibacterota bacterium]